MHRPGSGATTWAVTAPFIVANVLFGAGLFAHAFLYNFYLEGLGHREALMGFAAASMTAGGLIGLVWSGAALDRWGPRRTYLFAASLAFAGLAFGAVVESGGAILAMGVVAGSGTAAWRVTMGPVLMVITSRQIRSRAFSWNVAALLASGSIWTAAAGVIPTWWSGLTGAPELSGIRVGLVACALGTLLSAPLAALVVPGHARGTEHEAPSPQRPAAAAAAPGGPTDGKPVSAHPAFLSSMWVPARFRWLAVLILVWMLGSAMVIPFFNIYFQRVHGLGVDRIGFVFAAAQALTAVVVVAGGELAQRLGTYRAFALWAVLFPIALILLAPSVGAVTALVLFALQGLAPPATNPLLDEMLLTEADPDQRGAVSSWRNGATELSGLLGSSVGGLLLTVGSFATLFVTAATISAAGAILLVRSWRSVRS